MRSRLESIATNSDHCSQTARCQNTYEGFKQGKKIGKCMQGLHQHKAATRGRQDRGAPKQGVPQEVLMPTPADGRPRTILPKPIEHTVSLIGGWALPRLGTAH